MTRYRPNQRLTPTTPSPSAPRQRPLGLRRFLAGGLPLLLLLVWAGCERSPSTPTAATAPPKAAQPFTGAAIEWPDRPIDAYVTHYVVDNQVLVSLRNTSRNQPVYIERIQLQFADGEGQELDHGAHALDRLLQPGEKTGLFSVLTENKGQLTRDVLNGKTKHLSIEVVLRETLKQSVAM